MTFLEAYWIYFENLAPKGLKEKIPWHVMLLKKFGSDDLFIV